MKSKVNILSSPDEAIKRLERLAKSMKGPNLVKVGLPKGSNDYPDGTSVIMVGTVQEFGSPSSNIPQRSFLRSTLNSNRHKYLDLFKKLSKRIVDEKMTVSKALGTVGLQVQTDVRQRITDIKEPPLKSRDGNPLVDTGHLRQSITYEVEK
jgi:phage gpG-like protein